MPCDYDICGEAAAHDADIVDDVGLDDDDRRLSLISSDKCERDESGRSLCYSSSDDTQSLATTTSATGNL